MPAERTTTQHVRAGVAVALSIAAVAGALWLWLYLKDHRRVDYAVRFTTDQGVYGLAVGSSVRVGGLVKGEVTDVAPIVHDGEVNGYLVRFDLEHSVTLYRAARIQASAEAIGGGASLDIVDVGRGRPLMGTQPLAARQVQPAPAGTEFTASTPGQFDSLVGSGNSTRLRALVERVRELREPVVAMAEDAPARLGAVREAWNELATAVRADVDGWRAQWAALTQHAERAVASIGMGESPPSDAVLPGLRAARDDFEAMDLGAKKERFDMARATLSSAIASLDSIQAQGFAIRNALSDAYDGLGLAAADFSIAGQELAATEREALAAPWKLFARPDQRQSDEAWRIEEARVFAQAATEFEAAVAGIRAAMQADAAELSKSPQLSELLSSRLGAASAAFDRAVERFSQVLTSPRPTDSPSVPAPHAK